MQDIINQEEELDIEEKTQTYPKRKNSKSKSKSKRQSISKKEENSDDKYIDVDVTKETKDSKLEDRDETAGRAWHQEAERTGDDAEAERRGLPQADCPALIYHRRQGDGHAAP